MWCFLKCLNGTKRLREHWNQSKSKHEFDGPITTKTSSTYLLEAR